MEKQSDRDILRRLAGEVAAIAALPVQGHWGQPFRGIGVSPSQYTLQAVSSCANMGAWQDICELSFPERFTTSRAGWWGIGVRNKRSYSKTMQTGRGFRSGFPSGSSNTTSGYFCLSA